MKFFLKCFLKFIGEIGSAILPYSLYLKIKNVNYLLYTYWIRKNFKAFGEGSLIKGKALVLGMEHISIGENVIFGKELVMAIHKRNVEGDFNPSIVVGDRANFGDFAHLTCVNKISIGKDVLIGRRVTITDNSHGKFDRHDLEISPSLRKLQSKNGVEIQDRVWIGENVVILPGVRIGEGCIIAAGAIVSKDIPPFSIAGGIPAKVIKQLEPLI